MAKYETDPRPSDQRFLELPRVYEDVPTETLKEVLEAAQKLTNEVDQYESAVGQSLGPHYRNGMKALSLAMMFRQDRAVARGSIQLLAELTLRVYRSGENGRYFINQYALENPNIFSGFDSEAVIHLATIWENQLSD